MASDASDLRTGRSTLGYWACLALVIGNIVGSGVFLMPAALAPYGWNALLGWLVTIAGSLCLAFTLARLAARFPREGGPYAYARIAFGDAAAFALAWSYWIALCVGNATIAIAAVSYLSLFAPAIATTPGLPPALTLALVWSLALLNCVSIRAVGGFQVVTTMLKLIPLAAAIVITLIVVGGDRGASLAPLRPGEISLGAVSATAALTLWTMLGFESATIPAGRVRDPERTIPRATMAGTLIAGGVYILACSGVILLLPADQAAASNAPFADFVARYWGTGPALAVGLFAAISAIGALNGWTLLLGEMPLAMARNGAFPRWFGVVSRAGTPVRAQLVSNALVALLVAANYSRSMGELFVFMALLATVANLILYLICALAALRFAKDGRMTPTAALIAAATLGAIYAIWTFFGAGAEATLWGAALLASGIPVYLLTRRAACSSPPPAAAAAALPE